MSVLLVIKIKMLRKASLVCCISIAVSLLIMIDQDNDQLIKEK